MKKMKSLLMLMAIAAHHSHLRVVMTIHGTTATIGTTTTDGMRITTRAAGDGTRATGTRVPAVRRTVS